MNEQKKDIVVIGYPIREPEERYYLEPAGVTDRIKQLGEGVQQIAIGSLRYIVEQIIREMEECAQNREWTAELTADIGLGPQPVHIAGKITLTIKSTNA